nr:PQQ-binding-like beta-propeller repeat protein [Pseudomonadales bacterium]NIX09170.1 PQQ-binding-like beta-propeller repeat protein [Pseudomonadales bacterium]
MKNWIVILAVVAVAALAYVFMQTEEKLPADAAEGPAGPEHSVGSIAMVDDARIEAAMEQEPGSWLAHGIDFRENRFSPLTQINRETVGELGLVWKKELGNYHAQEATPLVVDGLMIFPTAWNVVFALDAATGETRWVYDPQVDRGRIGTIWAPFSRGIAVYKGRVYVATIDGHLIAVNA